MRRSSLDPLRAALLAVIAPSLACTGKAAPESPTGPVLVETRNKPAPAPGPEKKPPTTPPDVCPGDSPLFDHDGQATGYAACDDGSVHRREAVTCTIDPVPNPCPGGDDVVMGNCKTDGDCQDGAHGRCVEVSGGQIRAPEGKSMCYCLSACEADADCASGECGAAVYNNGCGAIAALACREEGDACRAHGDCDEDRWCVAVGPAGPGESPSWQCEAMNCVIGRPLIVDGAARVARRKMSREWDTFLDGRASADPAGRASDAELSPDGHTLPDRGATSDPQRRASPGKLSREWDMTIEIDPPRSPQRRAALAEHWAAAGLLEHASIASFARFSVELLALGAPPGLLARTAAAARDEIRHARLSLALARLHGRDIAPGRLELAGLASGRPTITSVALALFAEACVGETLGAAEARAAAEGCRDPELAAELAALADDEQTHAELAWASLCWLWDSCPPDARGELRAGLVDALAAAARGLGGTPIPGHTPLAARGGSPRVASRRVFRRWRGDETKLYRAYCEFRRQRQRRKDQARRPGDFHLGLLGPGVLAAGERRALHRRVLDEVVGPCLATVLGGDRADRPDHRRM